MCDFKKKCLHKAHEENLCISEKSQSSRSILHFLICDHEQHFQKGVSLQAKDFIIV